MEDVGYVVIVCRYQSLAFKPLIENTNQSGMVDSIFLMDYATALVHTVSLSAVAASGVISAL
jgi:hypothetical protein